MWPNKFYRPCFLWIFYHRNLSIFCDSPYGFCLSSSTLSSRKKEQEVEMKNEKNEIEGDRVEMKDDFFHR
jgi:hypothetical protein